MSAVSAQTKSDPSVEWWPSAARLRVVRGLAAALLVLGLSVVVGWLFRIEALTEVRPGLTAMVFDTALCFVLCGCALGLNAGTARQRAWSWLPAALLIVLAALNAIYLGFGITSGIELADLHRWNDDGNPRPGQMSTVTTLCWLLAGLALLLLRLRTSMRLVDTAIRLLAFMVFAMGLAATIGYALRIELLFSWYAFSRMALHTAIGMTLLAVALWISREVKRSAAPRERELMRVGVMTLVAVALVSGLVGVAVFRVEGEVALGKSLSLARDARAEQLGATLQQRATQASIVTTSGELIHLLRLLAQAPEDRATLNSAQDVIESFMPYGFSAIELQSANGMLLTSSGTAATGVSIRAAVDPGVAGVHELLWGGGFVLRSRYEVSDAGDRVGSLIVEQPLPMLEKALTSADELGNTAEVMLCVSGKGAIQCFPNRRRVEPFSADVAGPVTKVLARASAGDKDVTTIRSGSITRMIAFAKVDSTSLMIAVLIDAAELYAPIRRGLFLGFLLIAAVTLLAALLLRALIRPIARELAATEGYNRAVIESLNETLLLFDGSGTVLTVNAAAERQFGLRRTELMGKTMFEDWQVLQENGRKWLPADYPSARVLKTGVAEYDVVMAVPRADGELRWLSASFVRVDRLPGRDDAGVVVGITDITEQRRAGALSRQLERRFRLLVDHVTDYGIYMLDRRGDVVSWNQGAERITGYRSEEALGHGFSRFYLADDQAAGVPARELEMALEQGQLAHEAWRQRKDSTRYWAGIVISPVYDERGAHIGFAKVVRDLTERRLAEQRVAEANRLRDAILDSAPYAILAVDSKGLITAVNPAFERMLWYRAVELVGIRTFNVIHDPREIEARAAELSAEIGRPFAAGFEVFTFTASQGRTDEREWTYIRRDSSRFPVRLAVTALRDGDGQITGYLCLAYDITESKRREEYTQHIAHHDFLTGLPNRMLLADRLEVAIERARRSGQPMALMMLDLDHFKRVNDSQGHQIGDLLLVEVARRLSSCVRASDTVARAGGDEFVILLPDVGTSLEPVQRIAAKIVERVSEPMNINGRELTVTPSIGIAFYPVDGDNSLLLMKNSDSALYSAKAAGRQGYRMFSRELATAAVQKRELETALRSAVRKAELRLHYQPQIDLETGEVVGMEALLRWTDPVLGPISPESFIPLAEEAGLILPLGDWVLQTAMRDAVELRRRTGKPLRLAINLSPRQFRENDLVESVQQALQASGLPASELELEITEGTLMADTEETQARLQALRALGISIAIDDFGVGFSSLSYITRFKIDTLKIDRCFVSQLPGSETDAAVAHAIITLARSLRIRVVAEGVETARQFEFMRSRHCDPGQRALFGALSTPHSFSVQGYYFSAALSLDDFAEGFPDFRKARQAVSEPAI